MARVLILLPARDFDPSEAAVSWRVLTNTRHAVNFATPDGRAAIADDMMLTGQGLDPWGAIPLLRNLPLIGRLMRANRDARQAYAEMIADPNYRRATALGCRRSFGVRCAAVARRASRTRHARISRKRNPAKRHVAHFFDAQKPVAAICHGVLLAARSISARTGRSVLWGYQTTALTWAFESSAWSVARITRFWDPNYYRTYLEQAASPRALCRCSRK